MLTAANMLRTGGGDIAVAVGYDNHARGAFNSSPARYGIADWYGETGMMVTTQYFAMKARRYLHDHGISEESLGRVSAKAFANAADNPLAWRRDPLTVEQVMTADMVNPPLTRYMFCAPDAGAVALVLARGERAFDLCDSPVRLAGVSLRGRRFGSFEVFSPWLTPGEHLSPTVDAAAAAFAASGVTPADVQTLPSTTRTYFEPPLTQACVQSRSAITPCPSAASSCFAPQALSLIFPDQVCSAAKESAGVRSSAAESTAWSR